MGAAHRLEHHVAKPAAAPFADRFNRVLGVDVDGPASRCPCGHLQRRVRLAEHDHAGAGGRRHLGDGQPHRTAADHGHAVARRHRGHPARVHGDRIHLDQRASLEADAVRQPVHHLLRHRQQLGEGAGPMRAADVDQAGRAQVVVSAQALRAAVARDGRLAHDAVSHREAGNIRPHGAHHAGQFVSRDARRPGHGRCAVVAVQIAAADAGGMRRDQHLAGSGNRIGHRLHANVAAAIEQSCLHARQW